MVYWLCILEAHRTPINSNHLPSLKVILCMNEAQDSYSTKASILFEECYPYKLHQPGKEWDQLIKPQRKATGNKPSIDPSQTLLSNHCKVKCNII